ncbi:PIN domain nuclease [Streptomyces sp. 8N706]|uniref:PIN domain nuclease n=1 Tax=Streptomyces sp. 8N706 TaxID=3457416 RepID=UPI003FD633DE
MNAARYLIDTSALVRVLKQPARDQWEKPLSEALIAVCPVTELEFLYSARSAEDREEIVEDLRALFGWVPVDDRAYTRAWAVQRELTALGRHRSAGPVDLVVAATAELQGLTLLHYDRDFETISGATGQATQWLMPSGSL